MENEKNKKIPAWLGRLCALFTAFVVCVAFCSLAFVRPSLPVKADFGAFASDFNYGFISTFGSGVTAATASDVSFGAALGAQLALFMISENCAQERALTPGATYNFTDFKSVTGYYQISGDDKYYPCVFCVDKSNNLVDGRYLALDGGLTICKAAHWETKIFPSSNASLVFMGYSGSGSFIGVSFGARGDGTVSVGTDWIPMQDSSFFSTRQTSYSRSGGFDTYFNMNGVNTFSASGNTVTPYVGYRNYLNASIICGNPSLNSPVLNDNFPEITVNPDNFPTMYDELIEDIPVPYRIFPDGFPVEEPTESNTEDTTESGDDIQPFTLPPEWLETYTFPLETYPTIPFTDVEPPSVDVSKQNGISFWFVLAKKVFDSDSSGGLWDYFWIIFGLAVATVLIWKLGSHGGDKD